MESKFTYNVRETKRISISVNDIVKITDVYSGIKQNGSVIIEIGNITIATINHNSDITGEVGDVETVVYSNIGLIRTSSINVATGFDYTESIITDIYEGDFFYMGNLKNIFDPDERCFLSGIIEISINESIFKIDGTFFPEDKDFKFVGCVESIE